MQAQTLPSRALAALGGHRSKGNRRLCGIKADQLLRRTVFLELRKDRPFYCSTPSFFSVGVGDVTPRAVSLLDDPYLPQSITPALHTVPAKPPTLSLRLSNLGKLETHPKTTGWDRVGSSVFRGFCLYSDVAVEASSC